jgi:phosphoribosylpyrophosphate synthetase
LVRAAKYGTDTDPTSAATELLAGRLALVIGHSAAFHKATDVVAVPSAHRLTPDLTRELARRENLSMAIRLRAPNGESDGFKVDGDANGKTVVLIDDVYRTGRTFDDAAAALKGAGADCVLGLVATCTFTASRESCGLDEVDRGADHWNLSPGAR